MPYCTPRASELVEPPAVVGEDLSLLRVGEVAAVPDLVDRPGEAVVPVGEVGGVDNLVLADQLEGLGQEPLVGLAREVDLARPYVLARLFPDVGRLDLTALVVLVVHPLHPVRRPARPPLEAGEAEVREALGDPLEDEGRELAHLAEGVRAGVRLDEAGEEIDAGAA